MSSIGDQIIRERLSRIQGHYGFFRSNPDVKVCVWLLEHDEFSMFDSFFDVEVTVAAKYPDLFLKFNTAFLGADVYDENLYQELYLAIQEFQNESENSLGILTWKPEPFASLPDQNSFSVFPYLSEFYCGVPELDDYLTIWLKPESVSDFTEFQEWLEKKLMREWPTFLKIMIFDNLRSPVFSDLCSGYPNSVLGIEPNLEMGDAMKEISSAAGDPTDPGTQFRNHFIDITQATAKGKMEEAVSSGEKAIFIANQENWSHLHISVLVTLGAGWMNAQQMESALTCFLSAEQLALNGIQEGNEIVAILLPNVLFAKGAVLLNMEDFEQAAETYKRIPSLVGDNFQHQLEGWRMAGFSFEKLDAYTDAQEVYQKALLVSDSMDPETLPESTLPHVGEALIRLNDVTENGRGIGVLLETFDKKLGAGWQERLETHTQ